jgi:hypothetical protein
MNIVKKGLKVLCEEGVITFIEKASLYVLHKLGGFIRNSLDYILAL